MLSPNLENSRKGNAGRKGILCMIYSSKLANAWTALQSCLEQALLCNGENTYKVPNLSKAKAARAETSISRCLECSDEVWAAGKRRFIRRDRHKGGRHKLRG